MAESEKVMAEWIARMRQLQGSGDTEAQHAYADEILCEALKHLGCEKLVEEWEKVPKWYA